MLIYTKITFFKIGGHAITGKFIALEGIDGSGKSTLVKIIKDRLRKEGYEAETFATIEPETKDIFQLITDSYKPSPDSPAYMFLFQFLHASKADRVFSYIEQEKIAIADRWDLSFFVWHNNFGFFSKEEKEIRDAVSRLAFNKVTPDLCIYLDVSVEKAIDRRLWRGEIIEDIEKEKVFYTKIVNVYRELAKQNNWVTIDADNEFEIVQSSVWSEVEKIIK